MRKRRMVAVAIAMAATLPAATALGAQAPKKRVVYGLVNEHFEITLKDASGKKVVRLRPGRVVFRIRDASSMHNFHLRGPGFDRATDIAGVGRVTWNVMLKDGKWRFRCDEHPLVMHGTFVVGPPPKG
jgi:hypothetical protein